MRLPSNILKINSIRIRKHLATSNPLSGDPWDPNRFLLNVSGVRKMSLPVAMKNEILIKELTKHRSLASFIRSCFFKSNFDKVASFFIAFKRLHLKYDFAFWIREKIDPNFLFNGVSHSISVSFI